MCHGQAEELIVDLETGQVQYEQDLLDVPGGMYCMVINDCPSFREGVPDEPTRTWFSTVDHLYDTERDLWAPQPAKGPPGDAGPP